MKAGYAYKVKVLAFFTLSYCTRWSGIRPKSMSPRSLYMWPNLEIGWAVNLI